jgi:hypothetical protein
MILRELHNRASDYKCDLAPQYDDLMFTLQSEGMLTELIKITAQCIAVHSRAIEDRVKNEDEDYELPIA